MNILDALTIFGRVSAGYLLILCLMLFPGLSLEGQSDGRKAGIILFENIPFGYIREGRGETMVVIGSAEYYSRAFSPSLRKKLDMAFVDSRHFIPVGDDQAASRLSLSEFARDVERMRDSLGLGKIFLLGHSVHAQIALEFATLFPDKLKGLILVAGVPFWSNEFPKEQNQFWQNHADEHRKSILKVREKAGESVLKSTLPESLFAVNYHIQAPKNWVDPEFDARYLLDYLKTNPKAFGDLFQSLPSEVEVKGKLNRLKMPCLLVLGQLDFTVPYTTWEPLLSGTGITYHLMPQASHNPFTESVSAGKFNRILLQWIKGNRIPQAINKK